MCEDIDNRQSSFPTELCCNTIHLVGVSIIYGEEDGSSQRLCSDKLISYFAYS